MGNYSLLMPIFKILTDMSSDAFFVHDDTKIYYINNKAKKILVNSLINFSGQIILLDIFQNNDFEKFKHYLDQLASNDNNSERCIVTLSQKNEINFDYILSSNLVHYNDFSFFITKIENIDKSKNASFTTEMKTYHSIIFDDLPVSMFEMDNDKNLVYVNHCFLKLFSFKNLDDLFHKYNSHKELFFHEISTFTHIFNLFQDTDLVRNYECQLVKNDGEVFWASVDIKVLFEEKTQIGFQGFVNDITTRVNFEEELKRSRNLFRLLIDTTDDSFVLLDLNGNVHACNIAFAERHNLHPRNAINSNYWEIGFSSEIEIIKKNIDITLQTGQPVSCSYETPNKIFNCTIYPFPNGNELDKKIAIYCHDITEIKKAEKIRIESEKRFKILFDNAHDPIFVHDIDGNFLEANFAFLNLIDYHNSDILSLTLNTIFDQDYILQQEKKFETLNLSLSLQLNLRTFSGNEIPMQLNISSIKYTGKNAYLCIGRDMIEWKQTEQLLLKAKNIAEESNKMKDEFLTNISHEFRTPLGSILGLTELTLKTSLNHKQQENLERIQTSAELLLGLINDILDYSKLESGKFKLHVKCFSLLGIMQDVRNSLLIYAKQKSLNFSFTIDDKLPEYICTDPLRLRQILYNLIGNAIKFTETGYVKVYINLDTSESKNLKNEIPIHIRIIDSGIGIDAVELNNIFERFTRTKEVIQKNIGGTGLGLAICKYLVELMGGNIWVESTKGKGSTFNVTLIVIEGSFEQSIIEIHNNNEIPKKNQRATILLVEDNQINRDMVSSMIKLQGNDVITASNGIEAINILEDMQVDLILMDLQMPELDGFQTTEKIRSSTNPQISNIPIIALTAHAFQEYVDKCTAAGMNHFISKPIQMQHLHQVISQILSDNQLQKKPIIENTQRTSLLTDSSDIFNITFFENSMDNNPQLLRKACDSFISHVDQYMLELSNAIKEKDTKNVTRIAHSLKSVTATFGSTRAQNIAIDIQNLGILSDWPNIVKKYDTLNSLIIQIKVKITDYLNTLS